MEAPQHCVLLQSTSVKPFMHVNFWCNLQAEASCWAPWEFYPCSKETSPPLGPSAPLHSSTYSLLKENGAVLTGKAGILGFISGLLKLKLI